MRSIPTGRCAGRRRGDSRFGPPRLSARAAKSGNTFWGSVDLYAFSLDQAGALRWQTFTPGYVTSSPALGSDGTVYVGSFDHKLYALDPDTGQVRWSFATDAHIYSSPALQTARTAAPARSTSPRPTARSTRSTHPGTCSGAMTPATRCAHPPCWEESRAAAAASSTWAPPTESSTHSMRRAAGADGPTTRLRGIRRSTTATI